MFDNPFVAALSWAMPSGKASDIETIMSQQGMSTIERQPALGTARNASRLFAAMFAGAYALVLLDRYLAGMFAIDWLALVLGALIVVLGTFGFPIVERRASRWLTAAYFAVQLPLGAAVFGESVVGGTFLLLVIVGQSVRVLPAWGTLLIGAPLPLLHWGMDWAGGLREGGTFLVALIFLVGFSQAMTRVERARAELDEANRKLRDYAAQTGELATARERNRIAREIHDGLGHYLTTIHMQIQAARGILAADPARAEQTLAKAQQLSQEALGDVRRSVAALRVAPADRPALPAALAELADAALAAGLPTRVVVVGAVRPLDPLEEHALYRTAQEGLTNARKHAQATTATLTLDFGDADRVRLTVADDGRGASATDGGFGLVGLRERVQLVGGSLTLRTAPGAGLTLIVEVPA
jgi:signal transduction histidine kinase